MWFKVERLPRSPKVLEPPYEKGCRQWVVGQDKCDRTVSEKRFVLGDVPPVRKLRWAQPDWQREASLWLFLSEPEALRGLHKLGFAALCGHVPPVVHLRGQREPVRHGGLDHHLIAPGVGVEV